MNFIKSLLIILALTLSINSIAQEKEAFETPYYDFQCLLMPESTVDYKKTFPKKLCDFSDENDPWYVNKILATVLKSRHDFGVIFSVNVLHSEYSKELNSYKEIEYINLFLNIGIDIPFKVVKSEHRIDNEAIEFKFKTLFQNQNAVAIGLQSRATKLQIKWKNGGIKTYTVQDRSLIANLMRCAIEGS